MQIYQALELRCLAHYMAKFDDGAYGKEIVEGDIHTTNQKAAGVPTSIMGKHSYMAFCMVLALPRLVTLLAVMKHRVKTYETSF